jgi:hypothetical protein
MKFHIVQFDHFGSPEQPGLFTSNDEMLAWISRQLDTQPDPLFPRLQGETPTDHASEFLKIQDEHCHDQDENALRGGTWNFDDDVLRVWDITFNSTPIPE